MDDLKKQKQKTKNELSSRHLLHKLAVKVYCQCQSSVLFYFNFVFTNNNNKENENENEKYKPAPGATAANATVTIIQSKREREREKTKNRKSKVPAAEVGFGGAFDGISCVPDATTQLIISANENEIQRKTYLLGCVM